MATFNRPERLVLRLVATGHTSAEIAEKLEVGESTVNEHRRAAWLKAGLENRDQMPRYIEQNPDILTKGGVGPVGLHDLSQACGCGSCRILGRAA